MLDSLLRTLVPIVVGAVIGQAAKYGLNLDEGAVTVIVTPTVTFVYYAVARVVEQAWPAAGRFLLSLGLAGTPTSYSKTPAAIRR